jgi:Xaa-Pro aminopeptidase
VGSRPSLPETQGALGIECRPSPSCRAGDFLRAARRARCIRVLPTLDGSVDTMVRAVTGLEFTGHLALKETLDQLRLIKNDWELEQLQLAVNSSVLGFENCVREWDIARASTPGERYLEGTFNRRARILRWPQAAE